MNTGQGRFITRGTGPDGQDTVDLIIGSGFKSNKLKPNTVYEIVEILGDLMIREVGASVVKPPKKDTDYIVGMSWGNSFDSIVTDHGGMHLLTEEEYKQLLDDEEEID